MKHNVIDKLRKLYPDQTFDIDLDITDLPGMTLRKLHNWCMERDIVVEVRKGRAYLPLITVKGRE